VFLIQYCDKKMGHKSTRKIIRIGDSSFAVILPRAWLRYHDLKYGDSVEVVSNGSVKIKPLRVEYAE